MARIPKKEQLSKASFQSRPRIGQPKATTPNVDRVDIGARNAGRGAQALAEGIGAVGATLERIGEREDQRNTASELADAELAAAKHRLELTHNLSNDPDYRTSRARYEERSREIGENLAAGISDPDKRATFQRRFEVDSTRDAINLDKKATKKDADAKRASLEGLLKGYRTRIADPDLTEEERDQIEEDAENAVLRLAAKGHNYLSRRNAQKLLVDFHTAAEGDLVIALTNAKRFEDARTILSKPTRLDRLAGGWTTSDKGDKNSQIAVAETAAAEGRSPALLLAIGDIESDGTFSVESTNPRSSALGIFHFLDENREWSESQGEVYGLDPVSQTRAMIAKMDSDRAIFQQKANRTPEPWEEYILHFQGAPMGTRLLLSDPDMPLEIAFGERADVIMKANPNLKKYETVGDFLGHYKQIFDRRLEKFSGNSAPAGSMRESQKRALLERVNAAEKRAFAQDGAELELLIEDDVASIEATGKGVGGIDMERAKTLLGNKKYADYVVERRLAEKKWEATGDLHELTAGEIQSRLNKLMPKGGEKGFSDRKAVYDAAADRAKTITKLRAKDPAKSVETIDFVRAAAAVDDGTPAARQTLIRARLKAQAMVGIPAVGRATITKTEAQMIMAPIESIARAARTDPTLNKDLAKQFELLVEEVEKTYGQFAKPVLDTALQHFTESRETAERLGGLLRRVVREGQIEGKSIRELTETLKEDREARALDPDRVSIEDEKQPSPNKPRAAPMKDDRPEGQRTQDQKNPRVTPHEYPKPHKGHINMLRNNPAMRDDFDRKFGPGAAERALSQ